MSIIVLNEVQPGDVILETGDPSVARAGGGRFGHASVFITQTLLLHAGKDDGVFLQNAEVKEWRCGGKDIVGIEVDGDVLVRRPNQERTVADLIAHALAQLGKDYAHISELNKIEGLPPATRRGLLRKIGRVEPPSSRALTGQYCSRLVAEVLGLKPIDQSPNDLEKSKQLQDLPNALMASLSCAYRRHHPVTDAVDEVMSLLAAGVVTDGWNDLSAAVDTVKARREYQHTLENAVDDPAAAADAQEPVGDTEEQLLISKFAREIEERVEAVLREQAAGLARILTIEGANLGFP